MQAQGILARAAIAPAPTARGRQCRVSAATVAVAPPAVLSRVTHSMPPEKAEVFRSLEGWASSSLLALLKPIEDFWQPTDFLPESSSEMFEHEVRDLRARATGLPDEYFVVLVGDMVTEEALPTYQAMTRRGPARAPGRCGRAPGPPRRTATVTSSASTCTSPAASACAWSRRPFSTSLVPAWTRERRTTRTCASCTPASRSARPPSRTATPRGLPRRTATTSWRAPEAPSPPTRSGTRRRTDASWSSC